MNHLELKLNNSDRVIPLSAVNRSLIPVDGFYEVYLYIPISTSSAEDIQYLVNLLREDKIYNILIRRPNEGPVMYDMYFDAGADVRSFTDNCDPPEFKREIMIAIGLDSLTTEYTYGV